MRPPIDYAAWFSEVEARKSELEQELAKLVPLLAYLRPLAMPDDPAQTVLEGTPERVLPTPAPPAPPAPSPPPPSTEATPAAGEEPVRRGLLYQNMNSLDAAMHYLLLSGGEPKQTMEVADALAAGGFPTRSPHFVNNIYSTLRRLAERGDVVRIGKGTWTLTAQGRGETATSDTPRDDASVSEEPSALDQLLYT